MGRDGEREERVWKRREGNFGERQRRLSHRGGERGVWKKGWEKGINDNGKGEKEAWWREMTHLLIHMILKLS